VGPERSGATGKILGAQHGLSTATLNQYRKHCLVSASDGDNLNLFVELLASLTTTSHASMETCGSPCVELRNGRRNRVGRGFDGRTLKHLSVALQTASHDCWAGRAKWHLRSYGRATDMRLGRPSWSKTFTQKVNVHNCSKKCRHGDRIQPSRGLSTSTSNRFIKAHSTPSHPFRIPFGVIGPK
jgi:hypothetical protein